MKAQWSFDHLLGYLGTWSATQRFTAATGADPLQEISDQLRSAWGPPEQIRKAVGPLTLRIGVNEMSEPLTD